MSVFDQRGQNVINQNNAARDINIESIQETKEIQYAIHKLNDTMLEVQKMIQSGAINQGLGAKVVENINDSSSELAKTKPDGQIIKSNLENAKLLLESIGSATGLITGLMQAIEIIKKIFG